MWGRNPRPRGCKALTVRSNKPNRFCPDHCVPDQTGLHLEKNNRNENENAGAAKVAVATADSIDIGVKASAKGVA